MADLSIDEISFVLSSSAVFLINYGGSARNGCSIPVLGYNLGPPTLLSTRAFGVAHAVLRLEWGVFSFLFRCCSSFLPNSSLLSAM